MTQAHEASGSGGGQRRQSTVEFLSSLLACSVPIIAGQSGPDRECVVPELEGSQTEQNLRAAFAIESQAALRYLYFAQQADIEGQPAIAALFRTVAETETGHALGHLDFLAEATDPITGAPIGSTEEYLDSAVQGETRDGEQMYPQFAETARAEGFGEVADWMESLARAERSQADRFTDERQALE